MTRSRRNSAGIGSPPGDHDGVLDVLANLVGILTLVGALSAVVAANAAVRIKTPMSRSTSKDYVLLVAGEKGIWNLQPAKDAMHTANTQRIAEMRNCFGYGIYAMSACFDRAKNRLRSAQVGGAFYRLDEYETSLKRTATPDIATSSSDADSQLMDLVGSIKRENKVAFVLLEKEGFESFRAIRTASNSIDLDLGWEPWETHGAVYFGSGGRSVTVQ